MWVHDAYTLCLLRMVKPFPFLQLKEQSAKVQAHVTFKGLGAAMLIGLFHVMLKHIHD